MRLTSGVCGIYYAFCGRPALRMTRSVDVLINHHSMHIIRTTRLKFFGHIAREDPRTTVERLQHVWPLCQGSGTANRADRVTPWLQTVESDLAPLSIGLATVYCGARSRQAWSTLVGTATSSATRHMMMMMMMS